MVIAEREGALSALIQESAAEAVKLALPAELAASFPESASRLEKRGAWQGPIEYITDSFTVVKP